VQTEDLALTRSLLAEQRLLTLAVLVDGAPCAGLLPFVATADLRAVAVHTSRMARHSRGLASGAPFSAVIHLPDGPALDPLQVPRLLLEGVVATVARGTADYDQLQGRYQAKLPTSAPTFALGDFDLHRLELASARLVVGFARAVRVDLEQLTLA
jgi:hypothetical protein